MQKVKVSLFLLLCLASAALSLTHWQEENGLDVIFAPKEGSHLVTILLSVKTGAKDETPDTNGLAHLYEHMFFKGNKVYPNQEAFTQRMRELGIVHNGSTSNEVVRYFFTLPSEKIEQGLAFMQQALLTPLFDKEELSKERKVVIGEYDRFESDLEFSLWKAVEKNAFPTTFTQKNPLGTRSVILHATRQQMLAFKEGYYHPNNSALIIVGDTKESDLRPLVSRYFSKWEKHTMLESSLLHPQLREKHIVIQEKPIQYFSLSLLFSGPDLAHQRRDTFIADLLSRLLSLPSTRFQKNLVDTDDFSSLSLSYYTQHTGGEIWIEAKSSKDKIVKGMKDLKTELESMVLSGYFTQKELERAKRLIQYDRMRTEESQVRYANSLGFWWAIAGLDYYQRYLSEIQAITLSDIHSFVQRYLYDRPFSGGMLIPQGEKKKSYRTLLSHFSLSFPIRAQTLHLKKTPLYIKPLPSATISLSAVFPGGSLNLNPQNEGIENLLFSLLGEGSKKYPRAKLLPLLEKYGATFSAHSSYDASVFSLSAPASTFYQALPLFIDALQHPLFEKEELNSEKHKLIQQLKQIEADPDEKVWRLANQIFFRKHPYRYSPEGTIHSLSTFTRSDLQDHYKKLQVEQPFFFVAAGPVLPDKLQKQLLPFGRSVVQKLPSLPSLALRKNIGKIFIQKAIPTYYIVGKLPLPNIASQDYAAAKLMMSLLSEKIEEVVRTQKALSYAAFAGAARYRANWGYLYVTTTQPKEALTAMLAILKECQTKPFSKEWVEGVKGMLLTRERLRQESPFSFSQALISSLLSGISLDQYNRWLQYLPKVTPQEVQSACRRYLSSPQFGIIGSKDREDILPRSF